MIVARLAQKKGTTILPHSIPTLLEEGYVLIVVTFAELVDGNIWNEPNMLDPYDVVLVFNKKI